MSTSATNAAEGASPFVSMTADMARREVLLAIARRFKGVDPSVDAKIDAAAERIYGIEGAKSVPAERPGAHRVPPHFEGEPGVGKTSIIEGAIREFCSITGLTYVENPAEDYIPQPLDFYYATVNLSGKTNPSDFGLMPYRSEIGAGGNHSSANPAVATRLAAGVAIGGKLAGRIRALCLYNSVNQPAMTSSVDGPWDVTEITVSGEAATTDKIIRAALRTVVEESKKDGLTVSREDDADAELDGDRVTYSIANSPTALRLTVRAPRPAAVKAEYVSATLPNLRFHLATKFRFSLFNFDDVANASEPVRNILLEVSQKGRYSGTMDIGNAMVVFTGNMGAEDNTNVMSRQSDAELTRVRKIRVHDTPSDWASRVTLKYATSPVGDCHMALFIKRYGDTEGIFREPPGASRGKRGVPKTNSRALENALSVIDAHFLVAQEAGISPLSPQILDRIENDFAATAGRRAALAYRAHLQAMLTDAVPLAEQVIREGKLDADKFNKLAPEFIKSSQKDFGFRFSYALADAASTEVIEAVKAQLEAGSMGNGGKEKELDLSVLQKITRNMAVGLAALPADLMNASVSRFAMRLCSVPQLGMVAGNTVTFNDACIHAISKAVGESVADGIWIDPEASVQDISRVLLGASGALKVGPKGGAKMKGNSKAQASAATTP